MRLQVSTLLRRLRSLACSPSVVFRGSPREGWNRWLSHARSWWREARQIWFPVRTLGDQGERVAARFLERLGYVILERQSRGNLGEIDLVAADGRTIVFVEVKTRRSHGKGHPADAVDERKQQRLTRLALAWLKQHDLLKHPARFDVVAVTWPKNSRRPDIQHFPDAFPAVGRWQMFC